MCDQEERHQDDIKYPEMGKRVDRQDVNDLEKNNGAIG